MKLFAAFLLSLSVALVVAVPGEKGVCSSRCDGSGSSCVIDMERRSESCGTCKAQTTIFQSCYVPNGKCSVMCENKGASCELGRDLRVSECGKCNFPDGSEVPLEEACTPVPSGRCDVKCGNPLASCAPSTLMVPNECGGCPSGMKPEIACRENYGRCSSKCSNGGQSCKPDTVEIPRECGICNKEVTPAESCATPPDGVCNDQCDRARAACTRALPGTTAMPVACGACGVNSTFACLPVFAKCRVSQLDAQGNEVVPVRVDAPSTAVYNMEGKSKGKVEFKVVVVGAGTSANCQTVKATLTEPATPTTPVTVTDITTTQQQQGGSKAFKISLKLPKMNAGRAKVMVEGCCASLAMMIGVPGGKSCYAWGDPHVVTFDKMRYSYMGVGDYWLVKTLDNSDAKTKGKADLAVQIRFVPMYKLVFDSKKNSFIEKPTSKSSRPISTAKAVAASDGDLRVALYAYHYATNGRASTSLFVVVKKISSGTTTTIDVRTMTQDVVPLVPGQADYGTLTKSKNSVKVDFAKTNTQIIYSKYQSTNSMNANIAVRPRPEYYTYPNSVRGLCGDMNDDANKDVHSRKDDTVTISRKGNKHRANPEHDAVAETWRVALSESLFDYDNTIIGVNAASLPADRYMLPGPSDMKYTFPSNHWWTQSPRLLSEEDGAQLSTAEDPVDTADPELLKTAQDACKLLKPPFAELADHYNCIHDFIVSAEDTGSIESSFAGVDSIISVQARECEANSGSDSLACKAAGGGCEDLNGCSNMGTCVNGRCECVVGRTGDDCSLPIACDKDTSCGKHGTCVRSNGGSRTFDCKCDRGFGGEQCEFVITADGKVLKLAGGQTNSVVDPDAFRASTTKGVPLTVLAAIGGGFFVILGTIIGGVICCRKKHPPPTKKQPLKNGSQTAAKPVEENRTASVSAAAPASSATTSAASAPACSATTASSSVDGTRNSSVSMAGVSKPVGSVADSAERPSTPSAINAGRTSQAPAPLTVGDRASVFERPTSPSASAKPRSSNAPRPSFAPKPLNTETSGECAKLSPRTSNVRMSITPKPLNTEAPAECPSPSAKLTPRSSLAPRPSVGQKALSVNTEVSGGSDRHVSPTPKSSPRSCVAPRPSAAPKPLNTEFTERSRSVSAVSPRSSFAPRPSAVPMPK